MMIKKLVELNGEYGGWLEIDPVKLKRVAVKFKLWLEQVDPNNDPFGFLEKDLPFVRDVVDGVVKLPAFFYPHSWELREGLLPREYMLASSPFYMTVCGGLYSPPEVIVKDGRYFAWVEWEGAELKGSE